MTRPLRGLVPVEVLAVVVVALVAMPIPKVVPLLAAATVSFWLRGRGFNLRGQPLFAAVGAIAGIVALAAALVAGSWFVEALSDRSVEWSAFPIVRGNAGQFVIVAIVVAVTAFASEIVLHGWLLERVLELGGKPPIAIMLAAFAEAFLVDGDLAARIGAFGFGAGLGWMYVAGGRSILAPTMARLTFMLGALVLEALRLVG